LARVRRTWIQSQLFDPCNPGIVNVCPGQEEPVCCTTRILLKLLDNAFLQSEFSDQATVRRILGNVLIGWDTTTSATNPEEVYLNLAASSGDMYVQLLKRTIDGQGFTQLPPDIWDVGSVIDGYSESKAMHSWWHHWNAFDSFRTDLGSPFALQANPIQLSGFKHRFIDGVTSATAGLGATLTGGTGTIGAVAIPAPGTVATVAVDALGLDADCDPCGQVDLSNAGILSQAGAIGTPRAWRFRINHKRPIRLREDEELVLDFQFRTNFPTVTNGKASDLLLLSGGIKSLIQF
jgi:hypothetical protein